MQPRAIHNVVQKVSKIFAEMPHRSQHPYIFRRKRQHYKKHSSKRLWVVFSTTGSSQGIHDSHQHTLQP